MSLRTSSSTNRAHIALFACIMTMLIPVAIRSTNVIHGTLRLFTMMLATAFILNVCLFFLYVVPNFRLRISSLTMIFLVCGALTLGLDVLIGLPLNYYDAFNLAIKTISMVLFCDTLKGTQIQEEQLYRYCKYLTVLAVVACIFNLVDNASSMSSVFNINISAYNVRMRSFFLNRNQFGMFLVVAFIYADFLFVRVKPKSRHILQLLFFVNIFLTFSRGSLLAVLVYVAAKHLLYTKNIKQMKNFVILMVVLGGFVLLLAAMPSLFDYISAKVFRVDNGATGRGDIWLMGLKTAMNNPITGVGLFTGVDIATAQGFQYEQFHSLLIDVLVSGGIIEVIIVVTILINTYRRCIANLRGTVYEPAVKSAFTALMCLGCFESVSFFSLGYVDTFFTVNFISMPLLMAGMQNIAAADAGRYNLTKG